MSKDEKEKNGQEDQYIQNDRRLYEDPDIDSPPVDHSLTENTVSDYSSNRDLNKENDKNPDEEENSDEDDSKEERDTYDKE